MGKDSWNGHSTSDDLLCEHDGDIDLALKTGLFLPDETTEKTEAEDQTKEFGDDESADKAASDAEKADPDDEKNTP